MWQSVLKCLHLKIWTFCFKTATLDIYMLANALLSALIRDQLHVTIIVLYCLSCSDFSIICPIIGSRSVLYIRKFPKQTNRRKGPSKIQFLFPVNLKRDQSLSDWNSDTHFFFLEFAQENNIQDNELEKSVRVKLKVGLETSDEEKYI